MTIQEAIKARHSVRAYKEQPMNKEIVKVLEDEILSLNRRSSEYYPSSLGNGRVATEEGAVNHEGRLHIQLIQDEPKAFLGTLAKYGRFRNVRNYLVMAGQKAEDLDERVGYYGEHLVLLAQTLGLNTSWVGLSYKKIPDTYVLDEGEVIKAYIAIGYGETQGRGHKIKTPEQVSNVTAITPPWFRRGVEAALLAPTAVNQQKFSFEYVGMNNNRHQVRAKKGFSLIGYTQMDLGIAKCHFEIGAGRDNFDWV